MGYQVYKLDGLIVAVEVYPSYPLRGDMISPSNHR